MRRQPELLAQPSASVLDERSQTNSSLRLLAKDGQGLAECDRHTKAILMMLHVESEHSPWSRAELERELAGVKGNPLDVTDAVDRLYASGLVHLSGELVTPTCAARRMDELRL